MKSTGIDGNLARRSREELQNKIRKSNRFDRASMQRMRVLIAVIPNESLS